MMVLLRVLMRLISFPGKRMMVFLQQSVYCVRLLSCLFLKKTGPEQKSSGLFVSIHFPSIVVFLIDNGF